MSPEPSLRCLASPQQEWFQTALDLSAGASERGHFLYSSLRPAPGFSFLSIINSLQRDFCKKEMHSTLKNMLWPKSNNGANNNSVGRNAMASQDMCPSPQLSGFLGSHRDLLSHQGCHADEAGSWNPC